MVLVCVTQQCAKLLHGQHSGSALVHAQVEEFHVITWEAKKEAIFEMPTGGAAKMRQVIAC